MNNSQKVDGTPVPQDETLLYNPQTSNIEVKHGKQCFIEVIDEVDLIASKCKERFSDGVQVSDFLSLAKTLLLDSKFREDAWRIFSNLGHLGPVFWTLTHTDDKEIYLHAKEKFLVLIGKKG